MAANVSIDGRKKSKFGIGVCAKLAYFLLEKVAMHSMPGNHADPSD